jgi:hypothetical protein
MTTETPAPPPTVIQSNVNIQKWTLVTHAAVIVLIVTATSVLAFKGVLNADSVVGLFGTALGFSGAAAAYGRGVRGSDGPNS